MQPSMQSFIAIDSKNTKEQQTYGILKNTGFLKSLITTLTCRRQPG